MLPLMEALRESGHEVILATTPKFLDSVRFVDVELRAVGAHWTEYTALEDAGRPGESYPDVVGRMMNETGPPQVIEDLSKLFKEEEIDLCVHGPFDVGASIASAINEVPNVVLAYALRHGIFASNMPPPYSPLRFEVVEERWRNSDYSQMRVKYGLPPSMYFPSEFRGERYLTLHLAPPSLEAWPTMLTFPNSHVFRPELMWKQARKAHDVDVSGWDRIIHVSTGTTGPYDDLHTARGLAPLFPKDAIVIADPSVDAPILEGNLFVLPWVSHQELLPKVDVFVHAGGWGSTIAALSHAIPSLVIPRWADQMVNSMRIEQAGYGLHIQPGFDLDAFKDYIDELLENDVYRQRTTLCAREIEQMTPIAEAIPLMEDLLAELKGARSG